MENSDQNYHLNEEDIALLEGTFSRILTYLNGNSDRDIPLATIHSPIDLYTAMDLSLIHI